MKTVLCAAALAALMACSACKGNEPPLEIPGMTFVEGGKFKMGYDKGKPNEKPERDVDLEKGFHLDKTEVTNEEYAKFIEATRRAAPKHWEGGKFAQGDGKLPVVNVNWDDAKGYAEWAGKRLPSEQEWEYAARGKDGRLYPWGNDWAGGKANNFEAGKGQPVEVGTFKDGKGPFGHLDLAGNVWEWTSSAASGGMVIKGGSYSPAEDRPRASLRAVLPKDAVREFVGFRCAKDE